METHGFFGVLFLAMVLVSIIGAALASRRVRARNRITQGNFFEFDSVTQLVAFCRSRFHAERVRSSSRTGEFLLYVELPGGESFESLIVHFEGRGIYAVLLPDPKMNPD